MKEKKSTSNVGNSKIKTEKDTEAKIKKDKVEDKEEEIKEREEEGTDLNMIKKRKKQ